jgi:hypothetical protein
MTAKSLFCGLMVALAPCATMAQDNITDAPHPSAARAITLDAPGDSIVWERIDELAGDHGLIGAHRFEQILEVNGWKKVGSAPPAPPSQASGFPFPPNEYRERSIGYYFDPGERRSAVFELVRSSSRLPNGAYRSTSLSLRLLSLSDDRPVVFETHRLEDEHIPWRVENRVF